MGGDSAGRVRALAGALVGVTLVLARVVAGCTRTPPDTSAGADCGPAWVTGWLAAQQPVPGDQLAGRTLRLRVRVDVPGDHAGGVVDLAAAVADPEDPARLRPDLDSGDSLHPSPAGHRALADAVDPRVLSGSRCLAVADQARE